MREIKSPGPSYTPAETFKPPTFAKKIDGLIRQITKLIQDNHMSLISATYILERAHIILQGVPLTPSEPVNSQKLADTFKKVTQELKEAGIKEINLNISTYDPKKVLRFLDSPEGALFLKQLGEKVVD